MEGGGAEPGKLGPQGPQLSRGGRGWAGTQKLGTMTAARVLAGSVSHYTGTRTPPSSSPCQAGCQGPGKQQLHRMGLRARERLVGQPSLKYWWDWAAGQSDGNEWPLLRGGCLEVWGLLCSPLPPLPGCDSSKSSRGHNEGALSAPPNSPRRMNLRLAASLGGDHREPTPPRPPVLASLGAREWGERKVGRAGTSARHAGCCQDVTNPSENKWPNFPENFLWGRPCSEQ